MLGKLNPRYLSCPVECPDNSVKPFDANRTNFCETCEKGNSIKKFKEKTLELWKQRLGAKDAGRFRFEKMLALLRDVIDYEDLPKDKISVKMKALLDAYLFEKSKAKSIQYWKEKTD